MRQGDAANQTIIHARSSDMGQLLLIDATFMVFDQNGTPVSRIEAALRAWSLWHGI
ncbi:MAG: hypothetical protein U5N55_02475 [Cypionkella sp.]|nr:hypothetical protein [Cypionkella sp.]